MELELVEVHHRYDRSASLQGLDLHVASGTIHAVMGATGCGKSTVLRLAGLLTKPASGLILVDGQPVPSRSRARLAVRRRTATVPQEPTLLRGSIRQNVGWGLRARGIRGTELRERTAQALDLLQLVDLADRRHDSLSGGERKRTALAAAVAVRPDLLLLDEPFSSSHPSLRRSLRELILAINRTLGTTVIVATHDVQDALSLAGALTVMDQGRAVQAGAVDEVLQQPHCAFIAEFAGTVNLLRVTGGSGTSCRVGELVIQTPEAVVPGTFLAIPSGQVLLGVSEPTTSARNRYPGHIVDLQPFEYGFLVTVACADVRISAVVTRGSVDELELAPGREVWVYFKVSAVRSYL